MIKNNLFKRGRFQGYQISLG